MSACTSARSVARAWRRSCWRCCRRWRRTGSEGDDRARRCGSEQPMIAEAPTLKVRRSGPLRGTCRVPGDKSISHRALLFGALADGAVEARGLGRGGDNLSTAAALRALGVDVAIEGSDARIAGVGFAG